MASPSSSSNCTRDETTYIMINLPSQSAISICHLNIIYSKLDDSCASLKSVTSSFLSILSVIKNGSESTFPLFKLVDTLGCVRVLVAQDFQAYNNRLFF